MRLVLPLLQRFYKIIASYHLPEDCTKREEYCCVKDERLSNYFHEIFFRLLLLFFCQVWHLKVSESCQTMLNVCICIWLDVSYHDDWSRMGYVGTLCGYLLLETSSWVHCVGTLLYILLADLCASNTHTQCTHWVFITRRRKTDRWQRKESHTCMFKLSLFPFILSRMCCK